jgi:phage baseplate assembly protein W
MPGLISGNPAPPVRSGMATRSARAASRSFVDAMVRMRRDYIWVPETNVGARSTNTISTLQLDFTRKLSPDKRAAIEHFSKFNVLLTEYGIFFALEFKKVNNRFPSSLQEFHSFVGSRLGVVVKDGIFYIREGDKLVKKVLYSSIQDKDGTSFVRMIPIPKPPVLVAIPKQISKEAVVIEKCAEFIRAMLAVKPGEILGMPEFGSRLWNELFEVINANTLSRIKSIVEEDIAVLCPNIQKEVQVTQVGQNEVLVRVLLRLDLTRVTVEASLSVSEGKVGIEVR